MAWWRRRWCWWFCGEKVGAKPKLKQQFPIKINTKKPHLPKHTKSKLTLTFNVILTTVFSGFGKYTKNNKQWFTTLFLTHLWRKKSKNDTAVLYTLIKQLVLFSSGVWKPKKNSQGRHLTVVKNKQADPSLVFLFHFEALNSWLPRVTTGVPSPMIVVKFISFSSIRSNSITT